MKRLLILIFSISLCYGAVSQEIDVEKLHRYFDALDKNDRWMDGVAIMKAGELVYTRSIGSCSIEGNIKAGENAKYRIGSISKSYTATLVMKAVEEDKLSLDDKLEAYFPQIENADRITIEDLLYQYWS